MRTQNFWLIKYFREDDRTQNNKNVLVNSEKFSRGLNRRCELKYATNLGELNFHLGVVVKHSGLTYFFLI